MEEIIAPVYVVGATISYGLWFGYWQNRFPTQAKSHKKSDMFDSILASILWPIFMFQYFVFYVKDEKKFYGFKFY